jgi:hypothetical protein
MVSQYRTLLRLAAMACASLGIVSGMYGATTLKASSPSVNAGGTDQFNLQVDSSLTPSTAQILWAVWPAVGSVSSSGLYTAPSSLVMSHNVKVVALVVPKDPSLAPVVAYSTLLVQPAVAISLSPSSAIVGASSTVQFTPTVSNSTNTNVTWSLSPAIGTISSSGLYTAPGTLTSSQAVTVTATSAVDTTKTASATISLVAAVSVSLTPASANLAAGQSTQFTPTVTNSTNTAVTWSLSSALGTISSSGVYTAPSAITTQQTVTVTATSVADPAAAASATITLSAAQALVMPIEVMGASTTTQSAQVTVPSSASVTGASLWLRIHGLQYQTQASIKVNNSSWIALNKANIQIQGLGASYGGIGGGFSTLTMLVPLPAGTVQTGANTVSFQFNGTDGNSSGFRVLALNFQLANGSQLIPASSFTQDDPSTWIAPSTAASDIAAGKALYQTAALIQPVAGGSSKTIKAHCGDCHTQDGRDLKYFNYSNNSIYSRSMFHGLNSTQANQIVSYIRSLSTPAPAQARPWNPPYQPGPGLDSQPVANWAAGAGLSAVLSNDAQMEQYVAPNGSTSAWSANQILNTQELPTSVQLPDWNHWLPRIHPMDSLGSTFTSSNYASLYTSLRAQLTANNSASYQNALGTIDNWSAAQDSLLGPLESPTSWDANNQRTVVYSASEWMMVKLWEINQEFGLEGMPQVPFGNQAESSRAWYTTRAFMTSPNMLHIPAGTGLGNGAAVTQTYLAYIWYHLQMILNPGNGQQAQHTPIDFPYVFGFIKDLSNNASQPNAMLELAWLVKGLQEETAHGVGPSQGFDGWSWNFSDPEVLVDHDWGELWNASNSTDRANLTTAYLQAWLTQASKYTTQQFYAGGWASSSDNPASMNPYTTMGGAFWFMLPRLRFYGINSTTISQYYSFAASLWPNANWALNKAATCTVNGPGSACSTD